MTATQFTQELTTLLERIEQLDPDAFVARCQEAQDTLERLASAEYQIVDTGTEFGKTLTRIDGQDQRAEGRVL